MNSIENKKKSFEKLIDLIDSIREKCPWDKEQTFESLSQLTIEETFELFEAIINDNKDEIKSELGDLLMHIILYSKIASEKKLFDIGTSLNIAGYLILACYLNFSDPSCNIRFLSSFSRIFAS